MKTSFLDQKRNRARFLLHIFGPLGPLWLTALKRTFPRFSLSALLWHCLVFSLLSKGGKGATYLVSGTNVAPLGYIATIILIVGIKPIMLTIKTQKTIIHQTYDPETNEPLRTYYTQNPIPEGSTFEVSCGGKIYLFRLDHHFVTDEKTSVIEFLGENTKS